MKLYHGSHKFIKKGSTLRASENLKTEINDEVEEIFENLKPKNKISRHEAVYGCEKIEDIDYCGGYTDIVYEINADEAEISDLAWLTEAKIAYENNDLYKVRDCAKKYWDGVVFYEKEKSCIEYRIKKAQIVKIIEINDYEIIQKEIDDKNILKSIDYIKNKLNFKSNIPYLYHVTLKENLKNIMDKGLLTKKCGIIHGKTNIRPEEKTVYLSKKDTSDNLPITIFDKELVVFQIDSSYINENNIYPDDFIYDAFEREEIFVDHEELIYDYNFDEEDAEIFFYILDAINDENLPLFFKNMWALYLEKEGEIAVAHNIPPEAIISVNNYELENKKNKNKLTR